MNRDKLIIFFILCTIALHAYLTLSYYPLKFAHSTGDALCNLNATFNCDAVSASRFSSLLGVPMALWGAATNLVLLCLILIRMLRLTDAPQRAFRYSFYLAGFIALTSVIMGGISMTMIGTYCLFCIIAYVLSFAVFALMCGQKEDGVLKKIGDDIYKLFGPAKMYLFSLVAIPALALLTHNAMTSQYGGQQFDRMAENAVLQWQSNPVEDFSQLPMLSKGPSREDAKMIVQEYADFLCGHCKNAAPTLHAFSLSASDIRTEFYAFPLDGACNKEIERSNGLSCFLSKATYCAAKQDKGWEVHDLIFKNQGEYFKLGSIQQFREKTEGLTANLGLDWTKIDECIEDSETQEYILNAAKQGANAGVRGTPSIYVNGKPLPRGQILPVLQKAYSKL